MNHTDRIAICEKCTNRKVNPRIGMVCSLTDEVPAFEESCAYFRLDPEKGYQMEMEARRREKDKTTNRRLVLWIGIYLPILVGLGFLTKYLLDKNTESRFEAATENFIVRLEEELEEGNTKTLTSLMDPYQLLIRGSQNGKLTAQLVADEAHPEIMDLLVMNAFLGNVQGVAITKIRHTIVGDKALLLYSMNARSGFLNYLEFEVRETEGQLKIVDGYSYATGQTFAQIVFNMIPQEVGSTYQLPGGFDSYEYGSMLRGLFEAYNQFLSGNARAAQDRMKMMPAKYMETRMYRLYNAYLQSDSTKKVEAYKALRAISPGDARFQAYATGLEIASGLKTGDFDEHIRPLKKYVGDHPSLNSLKGMGYLRTKDKAGLCKEADIVVKSLPNHFNSQYLKMACMILSGEYKKALEFSEKVSQEFGLNIYRWDLFYQEFPEMLESQEFEDFMIARYRGLED